MDTLDEFILFNAYEDAREKMERDDDDRRDYSFKTSSSWDSSDEKSDDNDDW